MSRSAQSPHASVPITARPGVHTLSEEISEPVQAFRRDAAVWRETAWRQAPFSADFDDRDGPLPEINRAMLLDRPSGLDTLEGPWHSGARGYERAEYALDLVVFRQLDGYGERERSLPYRIIHGDRRFADHARSGQGMPWRCSARALLIEAAAAIEALDEAAVRRELSIEEMVRGGVYKTRRRMTRTRHSRAPWTTCDGSRAPTAASPPTATT
ncbi:hypothetical protein [Actinomadura harenae]|uniref:Uncharacterized protein n=1 Tax=Actinomadura harenae TaxID=2483351 RepID=A0A3M2M6W0_9ACTN|nr:hypothetical protein [Actinomadura harenae]RMI45437.1 hypothetical protein EBO15_09465 [Actinomadura harenae]